MPAAKGSARTPLGPTRKANGDQLQDRIKNTVGPWKAGKFMPITLRPYSPNNYVLSKGWLKCNSINLRLADSNNISSQVKSWLYQDCYEKPSEIILYRDSKDGGLGLFHVRIRALALLIRSFLETALYPIFRHKLGPALARLMLSLIQVFDLNSLNMLQTG